ncbi:MAG: FAD-binding oxidoreductase [Planctomycetota bacterium]|nr:FAD-binding oxidoreductase [Planctomycetota bacterium]
MKLKSGCIYWPQIYKGPEAHFPKLDADVECDVAIIGGGITGALVGYHLAREGIDTVMVDRHEAGHGSTSASTGLLQYEIDTPLIELIEKIGKVRAIAAYRASVESVRAFEPLVDELGDSRGLVARPSLYLASEEKDVEQLHSECEARQSMGIDVRFIQKEALKDEFNIDRPAALWSPLAFEVDPFELTLQLIRRAAQKGLRVFNHTEATDLSPCGERMSVRTGSGVTLTAKKVIFATGYEATPLIPRGLCRLLSTYAFASEAISDFSTWPQRCLIWEAARPYVYMRTTVDGRAIVGGADEEIVDPGQRDALLEKKTQYLQKRFSDLFPQIPIGASCAWAGTFSQTKDGLPYIGALPQFPNSFFALGYGGNGITFSLLAAQVIRDHILGRDNPYTGLFSFSR